MVLEDGIMFSIVGASYWNGSQGALWGVILFFHLDAIYMSVLRLWHPIKMYTCFLLLCVHAVLQLKITQTSNQASKQTNLSNSHTFLLTLQNLFTPQSHTTNFLNLLLLLPLFPHIALLPQLTPMWLSLQWSANTTHVKPKGKKNSTFNLLDFPAIFNTASHFLVTNILFIWLLWHNTCRVLFLVLLWLHLCLFVLPLAITCWSSHKLSALDFHFSFYAPSLSDLIHSYISAQFIFNLQLAEAPLVSLSCTLIYLIT